MKKTLIAIVLLNIWSNLFAGAVETSNCDIAPVIEKEFFPVGDERGAYVLTKKQISRDCNITIKTNGRCLKYNKETVDTLQYQDNFNSYRSAYYGSGLGESLATIHAMEMIPKIWTGWHGYCEKGWDVDMSWATDPMYWASLVMSTVADGMDSGGDNVIKDSSIGQAYNSGMDSYESALGNVMKKVGYEVTASTVSCLASGSVDLLTVGASYFMEDDGPPCNPVDEFCDEENDQQEAQDEIFPISKESYYNLSEEDRKYLEIVGPSFFSKSIDEEGNIIDVEMVNVQRVSPSPEEMLSMSANEMAEMQEKLKQVKATVGALYAAGKMGLCIGTKGSVGSGSGSVIPTGSDQGRATATTLAKTGLGFIPAEAMGPYGPLLKASLSVIIDLAGSFKEIDSCTKEKDANLKGSKHVATCKAGKYNLCVTYLKEKKSDIFPNFKKYGYSKCCYDQMMTKVLVTQMKAQLGQDFKNCTGITLDDIKKVNWSQCNRDDMEKKAGDTYIPGKNNCLDGSLEKNLQNKDYKPEMSCQYQQKCIDLTEFNNYLKEQIDSGIDTGTLNEIFGDTEDYIDKEGL